MLDALDAAAVRAWAASALASLEAHCAELDALNVFPIPDGDTGTNLVLTVRAALDALDGTEPDAAQVLRRLARGAVLGALGNSGGIMAQLLVSLAAAVTDAGAFDATSLARGLERGARDARSAVKNPVEGTILTVARAAADASATGGTFAELAASSLAAAEEALKHTTDQLEELSRAGVVDAGGRGLVLVLDALVRTAGGLPDAVVATPAEPEYHDRPEGAFAYEVQYLLDTAPDASAAMIDGLREVLATLGDSVVVVGTGDGVWNVHAHVNDVGAAIEAGIGVGRPHRVSVVRFDDQVVAAARAARGTGSAVIAVATGVALGNLFEGEGVHVFAGSEPGVADLLEAIRASGAADVVLLPNAARIRGIAEAAADQARDLGIRVSLVPTRSPVQGLAAVAVHDRSRRFDDDVVAMAEAAAATRFAEVAVAEKQSLTSVGICQAGDLLGLIDGEVVEIGHGMLSVALALTDRLLAVGPELVTLLVGARAQPGTGRVVDRHVRERSPLTEVSVYQVDEASLALVIGAE